MIRRNDEVVVRWDGGEERFDYLVTTLVPSVFQNLFEDSDHENRALGALFTPILSVPLLWLNYPDWSGTGVLAFRHKVLAVL